jgi:uncharacterized protein (DUF1499 family)
MLASTVQFSNNDQPPITPPWRASALGPALKAAKLRPCPQTPNSVPDQIPSEDHAFHTLASSTCKPPTRDPGRIINVPPMSNQHQTFADVLASDQVPEGPR